MFAFRFISVIFFTYTFYPVWCQGYSSLINWGVSSPVLYSAKDLHKSNLFFKDLVKSYLENHLRLAFLIWEIAILIFECLLVYSSFLFILGKLWYLMVSQKSYTWYVFKCISIYHIIYLELFPLWFMSPLIFDIQ